MAVRIVPTALAAAAIAHGGQTLFLLLAPEAIPFSLSLSQWLVIALFNLVVAALLGNRLENRLWAAALFLAPVAAALSFGAAFDAGQTGLVLSVLAALAIALLWLFLPVGPVAPLVASCAGALLGAAISLHRVRPAWSAGPDLSLFVLSILITSGVTLTFFAAHRLRKLSEPSLRTALGMTLFAGIISLVVTIPATQPAPGVTGASTPGSASRPIVLIVLDTLRADHLRLFGYHRNTMPDLERFAREHAIVSKRSFANSAHSLPSHASMFTGLYPIHHGAHTPFLDDPDPRRFGYPLDPSVPTLAALLTAQGYWTVGISANYGPLAPDLGLSRGFQSYSASPSPRLEVRQRSPWALDPGSQERFQPLLAGLDRLPPFSFEEFFLGPSYLRADEITNKAMSVVDAAGSVPFFLFLNYFDPHAPYYAPAGFRDKFPGRDPALGLRGLPRATRRAVLSGERDLTEAEYAHVTALYDGELNFLDAELGRLLRHLSRHERWDDMLVILTSDHGEAFGEHRYLEHGTSLYNELLWVPLIVKTPDSGSEPPAVDGVVNDLVQSVDLFPMVLAHARVPIPSGIDGLAWGRGRAQAPAWQFVERSYLQYGEDRFLRELRSVTTGNWKLIQSSRGSVELYDLGTDPAETLDLHSSQPDTVEVLLAGFEGIGPPRRRHVGDDEGLSRETEKRLRALGYID